MKLPTYFFAFALLTVVTVVHSAVHLSPSKTGSAIIVPFYTVSNQMNTLLSLNNTTDDNKAVKIHFKEAKNGDLLASFNVYLTGQDMWTMAMGQVPSIDGGRIRMVSNDQSCTVGFPNNEDIPVDEDWLWENGTIEIIEMGTLLPTEAPLAHRSCELLNEMWQAGQNWSSNSEDQLSEATGGLHAEVTLMDVEQGHSANIPVIHMDGFYGEDNIQHTAAGEPTPNLSTGTKDSLVISNGQAIETTWPTGYEAISALLMKNNLINEINLEPSVAAQTEWVVSFPTLFYHLNDENSAQTPFKIVNNLIWFPGYFDANLMYFNREGFGQYFQCMIICQPFPVGYISHSVNNLVMYKHRQSNNEVNPMLSRLNSENTLVTDIIDYDSGDVFSYDSGKLHIKIKPELGFSIPNSRGSDSNNSEITHEFHGLPVIGFAYTKFSNANAQPGLLAQYAFVREHFGKTKVEVISE